MIFLIIMLSFYILYIGFGNAVIAYVLYNDYHPLVADPASGR